MGLVVVLLRWTHLFFSIRAAHKAIRHPTRLNRTAARGRRGGGQAGRGRGRRRAADERQDALRAILTRFFIWVLYRRIESILDRVGRWILFYDTAKTLFLFWLLISHDFAASQLFHAAIEPVIQPYEPLIDDLAGRTVRGIHAVNFLSLLLLTHATRLLPPLFQEGTRTTYLYLHTAASWARDGVSSLWKQREEGQADDNRDGERLEEKPPQPKQPSGPTAQRNGLGSAYHLGDNFRPPYGTLPGSWRFGDSPPGPLRPSLPQLWTAASTSIPGPRAQPVASSSRRVVSNGAHTRNLKNGKGADTASSVRTLPRMPRVPTGEPASAPSKVRLMPEWPAPQETHTAPASNSRPIEENDEKPPSTATKKKRTRSVMRTDEGGTASKEDEAADLPAPPPARKRARTKAQHDDDEVDANVQDDEIAAAGTPLSPSSPGSTRTRRARPKRSASELAGGSSPARKEKSSASVGPKERIIKAGGGHAPTDGRRSRANGESQTADGPGSMPRRTRRQAVNRPGQG
ncbi:hypothetical protein V8E36_001774 [Tilletia maclaganii]